VTTRRGVRYPASAVPARSYRHRKSPRRPRRRDPADPHFEMGWRHRSGRVVLRPCHASVTRIAHLPRKRGPRCRELADLRARSLPPDQCGPAAQESGALQDEIAHRPELSADWARGEARTPQRLGPPAHLTRRSQRSESFGQAVRSRCARKARRCESAPHPAAKGRRPQLPAAHLPRNRGLDRSLRRATMDRRPELPAHRQMGPRAADAPEPPGERVARQAQTRQGAPERAGPKPPPPPVPPPAR
jgi:hypothetical protein